MKNMLRTKKMRKVRLIVLKSHIENLIKDLHEAGLVDIRQARYEGLDEGRPLPSFDDLSAELLKLRTVLSLMESSLGKIEEHEPKAIPGIEALERSRRLDANLKLKTLNSEASELSERIRALDNEALTVEKVLHFKDVDFSRLSTRSLGYRVGELAQAKLVKLGEKLERTGAQTAVISEIGYHAALIIYEKKVQPDVDALLAEAGFNDIELPDGMTTPIDTISRIHAEIGEKKSRLKETRARMAELSKKDIDIVRMLLHSLEIESERAEIASRFSSSKCAYVLEGWIMDKEYPQLGRILERYPDIISDEVHYGHDEMPPTVLDNPGVIGPMEFVTKSYSLPNYYEIDPTMMYFIALPILYGMIVGDVLYGVMSFLMSMWLLKKFEKSYIMSNVAKIWMYSAIPTMAFGLFFDEWAGMSHFHLLEVIGKWLGVAILHAPLYTGFHRMESVLALIGLSVLAGIIHLTAGFIIGAINEWNHSKKHAFAKIAWIGVEFGVVFALLPFLPGMLPELGHFDPAFTTVGLVVLAISVVALGITEGVIGIIEVPGLIGNILSYSRIAAIGIVGVVIAELLNEFIIPLPEKGLLSLVLLPVFVIFHMLNCFVAMFESLVQGGRLNIVEFRSKFLKGGGDVFIPFALYSKKY